MQKYLKLLGLLVLLIVATKSQKAHAATINVPSQYNTIQKAVNAAGNGDTIQVASGTYNESIQVLGKYVQIVGAGAGSTQITAQGATTAVMFQNVPYKPGMPRAKLSGFRIVNGNAPDGQGGGVTIANYADPIIEQNVIEFNHAQSHGGGILVFNNSNPTIKSNTIQSNSCVLFGGAIFVVKYSNPIIYGNTLSNNTATGGVISGGGPSGGAIFLENDTSNLASRSKPVVISNTITNNNAQFAGGAIALRVGVDAIIEDNTISNNSAPYGGGIHIETEGSSPKIIGNTISSNTSSAAGIYSGSGAGGGISVYNTSRPLIKENIISGNAASRYGGGIVLSEGSNSTIEKNTISGNYVADTNCIYSGGGIYIANATGRATNNYIDNNSAPIGGGIAVISGGVMNITNNTIAKNAANCTSTQAAGGGIFVEVNASSATIVNNIIQQNLDYQIFEERKKAIIDNNLLANDNRGMFYSYDTNALTTATAINNSSNVNATGNMSGSANFTNSAGNDFSITSGSVAIDTADAGQSPSDDVRNLSRPSGGGPDVGAFEYAASPTPKNTVYRFWSNDYSGHFYTISKTERNTVISNYPYQTWPYESRAYDAFTSAVAGSTPIYRFWSDAYQAHFYTADSGERDYVIATYPTTTWRYEGTVFNAYPLSYTNAADTVYRFWGGVYQNHFYTADAGEKDYVAANYPSNVWQLEGAKFKVPK